MIILSVSDLTVSFGTDVVLDHLSFGINAGERVGVVGVNGAGKSVLFQAITGRIVPEEGEVHLAKDKAVGFLEQQPIYQSEKDLYTEMLAAYPQLLEMEQRLSALSQALSQPCRDQSEHLKLAEAYAALEERFQREGGYEYKSRIRSTLSALGFSSEQQSLSVNALSGGQKTRLALVKLLLSEPDLFLLDEPTNHLDMDATVWLEETLKGYKKTLMVISHDRFFLDRVTNRTLDVENCKAKLYPCAYTEYVARKKEDRKNDEKHYKEQQKEIARLEAYIENQRRWGRERNIIAAESRQKALDRMERVEKPANEPERVHFNFSSGKSPLYSAQLLTVRGLSKAFGDHKLFANLDFTLKGGDRMFVLGPNGVGKSTLMKILAGKILPDNGVFEYAKGIRIGYYDQEHQGLNPENTILDELWECYPDKKQSEIRGVLGRFLFRTDDVFKPISVLSGGERARLTFAKLMLDEYNLLILDEPTNHLDANSREVLEEAILGYDGTVLAVSHDRYFIRRLAGRILEMRPYPAQVFDFPSGYDDYLSYLEKSREAGQGGKAAKPCASAKDEYQKSKEEKSRRRRAENGIARAEDGIAKTEKRLDEIAKELELYSRDYQKLEQLHAEAVELERERDCYYADWEAWTEELS